jgi:alkaline phosphatase
MSRNDAPLLVQRPSSEMSNEQAAAEEDALLTGERQKDKETSALRTWGVAGLSVWAVLSTIILVILAVLYNQARRENEADNSPHPKGKRNLIFMVSDGMGPSTEHFSDCLVTVTNL